MDRLGSVDNFVDGVVDGWEMRERSRTFYPVRNRRVCERVLTDKHSLIIQKTVYSILVIDII